MQYEPVEDEITLAGFVDMLLWHVWKCMDVYDQGPKLAVHGQVQYLLPQSLQALKNSIRCILHALEVLHQAGFAHTDLRWENIILQHAGQWVLIDLEFACVLNTVPFTPEGHDRKEDLLHPEQFAPSQLSGASQIAAHPLNDGYDFPASQECSQTYGKPKKKVNHPLKYEEFADSPNINEAEKRKLRRRTANRESARRVRDRRTKHSGKLEAKVAAVAATHDKLAQQIAHVEGERQLASSLCQTFHSRLSALQQTNEGLALEVTHLEQSLEQGVPLIHVRSDALTIGNGKSHGPGVASTAEQNIVGLPASQPISSPADMPAPSSAWQPRQQLNTESRPFCHAGPILQPWQGGSSHESVG
ncbi:hypothetical protein WJX82_000356 [Trebouxia sp. C0006]